MAPRNHAAWLKSKGAAELVVEEAPYSHPSAYEIVIQNKAVGINPGEVSVQKLGVRVNGYPSILGSEVAGIVEEVGSGLTSVFKPGDRVVARANRMVANKYAGYQEYVVLSPPLLARIPDHIKFTEAVVLPVGMTTASSCLFDSTTLGLEMPPGSGGQGKTLLIWGASSAIGLAGVQLAAAAGYEVFGVASRHNHELVKSVGATRCYDRHSVNVVDEIVADLKGKEIVGAYDAISQKETTTALCEILHRSGGRKLIAAVLPVEDYVKHDVVIKTNFTVNVEKSGIGQHIWQDFLEPGLASGAVQCKPDAEVVGSSLDDIQKGLNLLAKGVSAKKIVVTLDG
ncbi:hypothetical protein AYL99_08140 [Fonsecaea erecta]|uniref:Enoyl reductase (ER) domain-containing protein n=1 Tax=Fonsecaea erecta TaxID=1367422 RepID=A0A178ZCL4_9EURO|nr:hypothetical protein AYL99_08140 [Fonsecaea erecta]OAP57402.1 hypothetical protein AYL99_08140 [Fonsecaea erecta]